MLTSQKQAFDEPLDLPMKIPNGVDVVEVPFGRLGVGAVGRILKSQRTRHWANIVRRWFVRRASVGVDPRGAWRKAAHNEALRLAQDADIVVSTFGPAVSHLIAYDMKLANPRLKWIADYRDLWSQRHITEIPARVRADEETMELSTVGVHADILTTVSDDAARQLRELTGKVVKTVPNGFDLDQRVVSQRLKEPAKKLDGPARIVYTGMIYKGFRDPAPLLEALACLHTAGEIKLGDVTVDFYGARIEAAQQLTANSRYSPFIRLMGHRSREEALEAQRSAAFLLLLESSAPEARGVLTGKIFEYMVSGRPILCIGSRPNYEIGKLLKKTNTGIVLSGNDVTAIYDVLLSTFNGKGIYDHYDPKLNEIMWYSRRHQAERMYKIISSLKGA